MIIIDTNVWIFGELDDAPERQIAIAKCRETIARDRVIINTIIASELFHGLSRLVDPVSAASKLSELFSSSDVDFLEFTEQSIIKAGKLARDFKMRINDALIAQQAIEIGASILTDNVKDFKKLGGALKIIPMRG